MNTQRLFSILIACGCVGLASPALSQTMTSPNYGINWDVSDGGGGTLLSSNYTLTDSVAQPGASGESVSLGYVHQSGFATPPDDDSDGVKSFMDNCILHANSSQYDSNGDGFGNRCDPDFDNSGVVNFADYANLINLFLTTPASPNWNPDMDADGNNVINFLEIAAFPSFFLSPPGPSAIAE